MGLYQTPYYGIDDQGNVLEHYGIKGMKWGVRRYVNEDGTLTPEGRQRYGDVSGEQLKQAIKNDKNLFKAQKQVSKYYKPLEGNFQAAVNRSNKKYDRAVQKGDTEKIEKRYNKKQDAKDDQDAFYDVIKSKLTDLEKLDPKERKVYIRKMYAPAKQDVRNGYIWGGVIGGAIEDGMRGYDIHKSVIDQKRVNKANAQAEKERQNTNKLTKEESDKLEKYIKKTPYDDDFNDKVVRYMDNLEKKRKQKI